MLKIIKAHHPRRHAKSFKYAFSGLFHTLVNEPNFRIQLLIVAALVFLGFRYGISSIEWAILTISMGILLSAEMINTVVENFIDALITEEHEAAKLIKDISAGFVLIAAIINLVVFYLIFAAYFGKFGI
jgi:undecaprenol kinase